MPYGSWDGLQTAVGQLSKKIDIYLFNLEKRGTKCKLSKQLEYFHNQMVRGKEKEKYLSISGYHAKLSVVFSNMAVHFSDEKLRNLSTSKLKREKQGKKKKKIRPAFSSQHVSKLHFTLIYEC